MLNDKKENNKIKFSVLVTLAKRKLVKSAACILCGGAQDHNLGVIFHSFSLLKFKKYCGWLYFHGYKFSWIEQNWHICGVPFPSQFIHKIANSWVLELVDQILYENHENRYPTKIKPSTVFQFFFILAHSAHLCKFILTYTQTIRCLFNVIQDILTIILVLACFSHTLSIYAT